jgi:hypothetical protein
MSIRGLPAFLMSRICERGARNFGRESRRGELYAAAVLGFLAVVLLLSAAVVLNVWIPVLVKLKSTAFSRLGLILIWIAATVIAYALLVPGGRYRRWSEEFKSRHTFVREKPAMIEALAISTVLALLVIGIALNWLKDVVLT